MTMAPIHPILMPTDFSEDSNAAFQMAKALARDYGARLVVLPPPDEEWVTVGYRTSRTGKLQEIRVFWVVSEVPETSDIPPRGISVVTSSIQKIRKFLFAPDEDAAEFFGEAHEIVASEAPGILHRQVRHQWHSVVLEQAVADLSLVL